jgi:hypothetical protein
VSDTPPAPTRAAVAAIFNAVLDGSMSRDDASRWAHPWVAAVNPAIEDAGVWKKLTILGMLDLRHGPDAPHLYPVDQLIQWRDELLGAP